MQYKKKILIVGGLGQDGYNFTNYAINKGHIVYVIATKNKKYIKRKNVYVKKIDISNSHRVYSLLKKFDSLDIYFFATHNIASFQAENFLLLKKNIMTNVNSLINFLEYIYKYNNKMKLFYSCSSHIFNQSRISPQNEKTEANFNSNYGLIKYLGKEICDFYRERKEVYCTVGILYNHVSKLLKGKFLIKQLIAKIKNSHNKYIYVNNPKSCIDIMSSRDAVRAMYKVMQLKRPGNFIISTNKATSVKMISDEICRQLNIKKKILLKNSKPNNRQSYSPNLIGNNLKLIKQTNWKPRDNLTDIVGLFLKKI